jgi:hypothetical protein
VRLVDGPVEWVGERRARAARVPPPLALFGRPRARLAPALHTHAHTNPPPENPTPPPPKARYRLPVSRAGAGSLVLVEGLDAVVAKTATVVAEAFDSEDVHIFRPLRFQTLR